jgi:hypothetical protein
MAEYVTGPVIPTEAPPGIVTEPWGAKYEYPAKISIREAKGACGAVDAEAGAAGAAAGALLED